MRFGLLISLLACTAAVGYGAFRFGGVIGKRLLKHDEPLQNLLQSGEEFSLAFEAAREQCGEDASQWPLEVRAQVAHFATKFADTQPVEALQRLNRRRSRMLLAGLLLTGGGLVLMLVSALHL